MIIVECICLSVLYHKFMSCWLQGACTVGPATPTSLLIPRVLRFNYEPLPPSCSFQNIAFEPRGIKEINASRRDRHSSTMAVQSRILVELLLTACLLASHTNAQGKSCKKKSLFSSIKYASIMINVVWDLLAYFKNAFLCSC